MNLQEVPLPDSSYSDAAKSFADQAVINRWAEYSLATGTRSPKKLADVPGLREAVSFGAGPHRAAKVVDGKCFVASDTHLYQVHSLSEVEQLGTFPGRSLGWITANKSQVLASTGPDAWVFDLAERSYTKITDPAFVGFISPDFINQMIVGIDRSRRFLYNSALEGQDDGALSYNDIERYESEGRPDRLRCSLVRGNEVLVFNEETTEVFGGTQGADVTNHILFRNKRIVIPHGCASAHGACIVGGVVCFVGDDGNGYTLSGYDAVPITPPPIVQAWAQCDLTKCFTTALETEGHLVWYVTFPDGYTWGYDLVASRLTGRAIWHQRQSFNLKRWRLNTLFQWRPPGERTPSWFGGAYDSGMIYRLDENYSLEGCDPLRRITRTGISHAQGNKRRTGAVRFEYNSGSAMSVCEDVTPVVPAAGGVFAAGLILSPPPGVVVFPYIGESLSGDLAYVANDLDSFASSASGICSVNGWVIFGWNGDTFRAQAPFSNWENVYGFGGFSQLCLHYDEVVCLGTALRVSSDNGASYSNVAYTAMTPAFGATTIASQDSLKSLDGKLVFGGNDSGDAAIEYSSGASLSSFTVVKVAVGKNTNIPAFCFTGTHWVMALGTGEVYRAAGIDGPYTMVMDAGDLIDAAYYPQVMTCNDSGLVLIAYAHADTTQKLLVSADHGATLTDETATFPGFSAALVCIDNVFYNGWDKTTNGVDWTTKNLAGDDEFARFDGLVEYSA